MGNPQNIAGQGFHTNPERICRTGRPKGVKNASTRLLKVLRRRIKGLNDVTNEIDNLTIAERMDFAIINQALKGNVNAYREIFDRFEGKIATKVELTGKDGSEVNIKHDLAKLTTDELFKLETMLAKTYTEEPITEDNEDEDNE